MKKTLILLILLIFNLPGFSHPWKPSHYVIIDTDGGIDDIRTISMLLASPDVRVLAVTISSGALSYENAYLKIKSLLNSYWHDGLPVGINRSGTFRSPEFPVALRAYWGNEGKLNHQSAPESIRLIGEILTAEKQEISFICLGGMTTASLAVKEIPSFSKKVKVIIWSAGKSDYEKGFNYLIDKESSEIIMKGIIPVKLVGNVNEPLFYDDALLKGISGIQTKYAGNITAFFKTAETKNHDYSFMANDEMVALFLHFPSLFHTDDSKSKVIIPSDINKLREGSLKILAGETVAGNQVIKAFPSDPLFYFDDIQPFVTDIISKYGRDEWSSGVIANELHRHLGVFAIIGVKMGIRAREYFNTGVDEFRTLTLAGSTPPLSCMNDGLQVSTGSTPGHGLLTVAETGQAIPSAEFTYMNRKLKLTLKPEIAQQISSELKEINFIHGLDSNIYWELVRKNSIKYWLELDRHEIFIIEEILG